MKRIFTLLGVCALVASLSMPASVKAAPVDDQALWGENITWGENIIWGGIIGDNITWGETTLPAGTLIGLSVASADTVYVWAWVPGTSAPFIVAEEDKAIWGV
jgi:hypothetical protein